MNEPTPQQAEVALRVQQAVLHELTLAATEGASLPELLAGAGAAIAGLIETMAGADKIAPWFEKQGEMVRGVMGRDR